MARQIEANGAQVLDRLRSTPYHLVLMDVCMPVMGGIEATAQIRDARSQVLNRDIPIVAMTANAMQSDRTMCLAAGMRRIEKMNQNRSPGCVPPPQIRAVLYLDKR